MVIVKNCKEVKGSFRKLASQGGVAWTLVNRTATDRLTYNGLGDGERQGKKTLKRKKEKKKKKKRKGIRWKKKKKRKRNMTMLTKRSREEEEKEEGKDNNDY